MEPISIEKFQIYDIFYNDEENYVIIMPFTFQPPVIKINSNLLSFKECPHKHTLIYSFKDEFKKSIILNINEQMFVTNVNLYPVYTNEIIFSTLVKDEDEFICTWIDFHLKLGVSRFVIYDNSEQGKTLPFVLKKYIDNKVVLLIRWNYKYYIEMSGLSCQTTQQNHSIYAFQTCKFIGLFDIDEYFNMQTTHIHIEDFFNEFITKNRINKQDISSFQIKNKSFYNPDELDSKNFLNIFNCDHITNGQQEKNFVIPKNVETFSVHMVTKGKPMYLINEKDAYFNHYIYLNKSARGRNKTLLKDNSILRFL